MRDRFWGTTTRSCWAHEGLAMETAYRETKRISPNSQAKSWNRSEPKATRNRGQLSRGSVGWLPSWWEYPPQQQTQAHSRSILECITVATVPPQQSQKMSSTCLALRRAVGWSPHWALWARTRLGWPQWGRPMTSSTKVRTVSPHFTLQVHLLKKEPWKWPRSPLLLAAAAKDNCTEAKALGPPF